MKNTIPENNVRSGTNKQSPNVTGAGETSRTMNDDIGNPKGDVSKDPHRARETGRADTDMDADRTDTMGGDLSSDS